MMMAIQIIIIITKIIIIIIMFSGCAADGFWRMAQLHGVN
jgi:hypothetical protein